jgi:hypothetical protein
MVVTSIRLKEAYSSLKQSRLNQALVFYNGLLADSRVKPIYSSTTGPQDKLREYLLSKGASTFRTKTKNCSLCGLI